MTEPTEPRAILIGPPGAGKSTVGALLAARLGVSFTDTDAEVEAVAGKPVGDIFVEDGEPAFRELERATIQQLSQRSKTVIATGGGLPTFGDNLEFLKTFALTVCLWADKEKIWERVRHQSHRPLLHDPDPQKKITELLAARAPFYKQADVLVNTGLRSPREVAQQIELQYKLARRSN